MNATKSYEIIVYLKVSSPLICLFDKDSQITGFELNMSWLSNKNSPVCEKDFVEFAMDLHDEFIVMVFSVLTNLRLWRFNFWHT